MSKKNLQACSKATDFISYAEDHGGKVKTCGAGVKVYGPNGNGGYVSIHANHPKELATGTRAALIKAFIALGLGVLLPIACLLQSLIGS